MKPLIAIMPRREKLLRLLGELKTPPSLEAAADGIGVSVRTLRRDIAWLAAAGYDVRIERGVVRYVQSTTPDIPGVPTQPTGSIQRLEPGRGSLVGRSQELDSAIDDLNAVILGETRVLVVSGEPGIGKTSLVQHIADTAAQGGAVVATGRATQEDGAPGFWPWIQAIRSLAQRNAQSQSPDLKDLGDSLVSRLLPIAEGTGGDATRDGGRDLAAVRFRLFDDLTRFLIRCSEEAPVVLMIDDLQWADAGSLELLRHLSSSLITDSILIATTVRSDEIHDNEFVRQTVAALARHPGHRRVVLEGLSKEDIGNVIEARTGRPSHLLLTEYVHGRTRGNPFFARELVEHLVAEDLLGVDAVKRLADGQVSMPESIRDVVETRLNVLSGCAIEALEMASLIGDEFGIESLQGVFRERTREEFREALEEGLAAGLLDEMVGEIGRFKFNHPLIKAAFMERQPNAVSAARHVQIAETLEPAGTPGEDFVASELAFHLQRAGSLVDPERLAHYSVIAGEQSLIASDWNAGLRQFEVALGAIDRIEANEPSETQETRRVHARALTGAGMAGLSTIPDPVAFERLNQAFDIELELGETESAIAIASHGWRWGWQTALDTTRARALELVDQSSPHYGWLLSGYGYDLAYGDGEIDRALVLINESLVIARNNDSKPLEARALVDLMLVRWLGDDRTACVEAYRDAHRFAFDLGDDWLVAHIGLIGAIAMAGSGDVEEALVLAHEARISAGRLGQPVFIFQQNAALWVLFRLVGDWDRMLDLQEELQRANPRLHQPPVDYAVVLSETQGNSPERVIDEALALLRAVSQTRAIPEILFIASTVAGLTQLVPDGSVVKAIEGVLDGVKATAGHRWSSYKSAVQHIAIRLARLGVEPRVSGVERSDIYAASTVVDPLANMSTKHAQALAYEMDGDRDRAEMAYRQALEDCQNYGLRPEFVWTSFDFATFLLKRNEGTDDQTLRDVISAGRAKASALRMSPVVERFESMTADLDQGPSDVPVDQFGFSRRESEIAELIARGLSNRDISERLLISLNTVQSHVSNVLAKTGAANRTEAAVLIKGVGGR